MNTATSLSRDLVEAQLSRVVQSTEFCNAPRLSSFLTYVVEESLAGRIDRLKGYTIGLEVFDKTADFDPQIDTIVRVQARTLRQKLEHYYAHDGAQDPIHISIAKGAYEPAFFMPSIKNGAETRDRHPPAAPTTKPSIAVLPFDDFSLSRNQESFSFGLNAETIRNLSRFKELAVFSRLTTSGAKQDKLSIAQMYATFGSDFVLEGSYRIDDAMVMITVNLIAARTGEIILAQHFNRDMTPSSIYIIQDEMAEKIATCVADRFGPIGNYAHRAARLGPTLKWEIYDLVCCYHQQSIQLPPPVRAKIKAGLTKALEADDTSSDAHATLAMVLVDEWRTSLNDLPSDDQLKLALVHGEKAVQCDPENATAHEAMAVCWFYLGEDQPFETAAQLALDLSPGHADTLGMIGFCYALRLHWAKAIPLLERAIKLSPLYVAWYWVPWVAGSIFTGQTVDALKQMQRFPAPRQFFYHASLIWLLVEVGDVNGAMDAKVKLLKVMPDFETVIMGRMRMTGFPDIWVKRVVAAWEKAGLEIAS